MHKTYKTYDLARHKYLQNDIYTLQHVARVLVILSKITERVENLKARFRVV